MDRGPSGSTSRTSHPGNASFLRGHRNGSTWQTSYDGGVIRYRTWCYRGNAGSRRDRASVRCVRNWPLPGDPLLHRSIFLMNGRTPQRDTPAPCRSTAWQMRFKGILHKKCNSKSELIKRSRRHSIYSYKTVLRGIITKTANIFSAVATVVFCFGANNACAKCSVDN